MGSDRALQVRVGALAGGLVLLLGACGGAGTATPAAPTVTAPEPVSSPTAERLPEERSAGSRSHDVTGPSFGVDRVAWPATAQGAVKLLNALPQTLRGQSIEVYYRPEDKDEGFGASAGAQYGVDNSISVADQYVTSDTESGEPELFTADQLLAARFGLVFGCAKGSYRGTIKPLEGGSGPGLSPSKGSSRPRWFSCTIDVAEGEDEFTGHAVGWISAKAAWLVITEDEKTARSLIAGLVAPPK